MARIDVDKLNPERRSPWPWVVFGGLAVFFLLLSFYSASTSGGRWGATELGPAPNPAELAAARALPTEVQRYLDFLQQPAPTEPELQHRYTINGLNRLSEALSALSTSARGEAQLAQLAALRGLTAQLEQSAPQSLEHSDLTRRALLSSTNLMAQLQASRGGPPLDALASLQERAERLDPSQPLSEQQREVERFFVGAGELLLLLGRPG